MGHHRGSRIPQCTQRNGAGNTHGDGHYVLHHHSAEDPLLHCQLDPPHRPHLIPLRPGVLLACRGWRKGHLRHQHSPLTRCVPLARLQNLTADIARPPAHCQIPAIHIHHEHGLHPCHGRHHQLEFQGTKDSFHA